MASCFALSSRRKTKRRSLPSSAGTGRSFLESAGAFSGTSRMPRTLARRRFSFSPAGARRSADGNRSRVGSTGPRAARQPTRGGPLSGDESARLASFLPGGHELPDGLRRLILERSGGYPFFLEEGVRQ